MSIPNILYTVKDPNSITFNVNTIKIPNLIATTSFNGVPISDVKGSNESETMTNKTLAAPSNVVAATSLAYNSNPSTNVWNVPMAGTSPTSGQVLTYAGGNAVWSTPSVSSSLSTWLSTSESMYNTGTVSQSGTTVTGSGVTFTADMVGGLVIFDSLIATDNSSFITAFVNSTTLTVMQTRTVTNDTYKIYYGGFQSDTSGNSSGGTMYNTKIIDQKNNFISEADETKKLNFDLSGSSTGVTTTISTTSSANRVITLPNVSTTLVGNSNNETISGAKVFSAATTQFETVNLTIGNSYKINAVDVLTATTLGSGVVNASLTSNTGNLTNTGTLNLTSGNSYKINAVDVLTATTLGSGVVNASLTSNTGNLTNTGTFTATGAISAGTFYKIGSARILHTGTQSLFVGESTATASTGSTVAVTGIGYGALSSIPNDNATTESTALGFNALNVLVSGTGNTVVGSNAGVALTTGSNNTLLGNYAGSNYTGSESGNVCIGKDVNGLLGESNVTRIRNIDGTATGATTNVVLVASGGNLLGTSTTNATLTGNLKITNGIKTNEITSVGANDNITIDANGTGQILFNTIVHGGCRFTGSASTRPIYITNTGSGVGVVIDALDTDGVGYMPHIGGHDDTFTQWKPLWINTGEKTIIGNATNATATTAGAKLYVTGNLVVETGNVYKIGTNTVLSQTTLGSTVVNASIASNTGSLSLSSGSKYQIASTDVLSVSELGATVNTASISSNLLTLSLAATKTYQINGVDVLSATNLGVNVANSYLTNNTGSFSLNTGSTFQINGATVLSATALGIGVTTAYIGTNNSSLSLGNGFNYQIDNVTVLTQTSLGSTVTTAYIYTNDSSLNLTTGNDYKIATTTVLTATSLGTGVFTSYLTNNIGNFSLATGYVYRIDGTDVLTATTLGTGIVNASIGINNNNFSLNSGYKYRINGVDVLTSNSLGTGINTAYITSNTGHFLNTGIIDTTISFDVNNVKVADANGFYFGSTNIVTFIKNPLISSAITIETPTKSGVLATKADIPFIINKTLAVTGTSLTSEYGCVRSNYEVNRVLLNYKVVVTTSYDVTVAVYDTTTGLLSTSSSLNITTGKTSLEFVLPSTLTLSSTEAYYLEITVSPAVASGEYLTCFSGFAYKV